MIEEAIAKLTAVYEANTALVKRNNELLEAVLASAGTAPAPAAETPAPAAEPKPKKDKKPLVVVTPPPAEDPVEEEESDAPEEKTYTITEALEASKKVLAADRDKNKPLLAKIREKFGVETVKDLKEDQIAPYMAELAKLEA